MKLLLDTHIFLWLIDDNKRLSEQYRQAIQDPRNEKYKPTAETKGLHLSYK